MTVIKNIEIAIDYIGYYSQRMYKEIKYQLLYRLINQRLLSPITDTIGVV